jgi:hypothetical protein
VLVRGVVVHHQVQLHGVAVVVDQVAVCPLDLLEERHELPVPMPGLECRGDLAAGDVQGGEQRRGAVTVVVMGAAFDQTGLHRWHRHGACST